MEPSTAKKFPLNPKDYKLYEEVGEGVSATVHRALCVPLNEIVAIKVLDLEKCNDGLDGIRREVQTMNLIHHQNLLRAHCSFPAGHTLWVVMPYMAGGSILHIMNYAHPEGFEEPVIATLLHVTLKALAYLHSEGHIHRDVKAGNILIDSNGAVKLADFGVSACMFDTGDRQQSRNTFVGTPCWMAPEVMQQLNGYEFKADIWSFGITALELAHGHAPFSKHPPMKVLLMTLQNAPPGLDYERDRRFSKSFKELVAACLVKDPKKRPTSEKLLKHHFFKNARSNEYLARSIVAGLAPLGERFKQLKAKDAHLVHNKALYRDKEQLSQQEYIRGISAWNFDIGDLKCQPALICDDELPNTEDRDPNAKRRERKIYNDFGIPTDSLSPDRTNHSIAVPSDEDSFNALLDPESSLASFPIKPLQALKGCFDVGEENMGMTTPNWNGTDKRVQQVLTKSLPRVADQEYERMESENMGQSSSVPYHTTTEPKKFSSGPLGANVFSPGRITVDENRIILGSFKEQLQPKYLLERNYSGPLVNRQKRDDNNLSSVEDVSNGAVIKLKGRFKVTSGDLNPKGPTNAVCEGPTLKLTTASILPSLQSLLQQNVVQREEIVKMIKYVEQNSGKQVDSGEMCSSCLLQLSPTTAREKELQCLATSLQQSIKGLTEELQKQKLKNIELERLLNVRKYQG